MSITFTDLEKVLSSHQNIGYKPLGEQYKMFSTHENIDIGIRVKNCYYGFEYGEGFTIIWNKNLSSLWYNRICILFDDVKLSNIYADDKIKLHLVFEQKYITVLLIPVEIIKL